MRESLKSLDLNNQELAHKTQKEHWSFDIDHRPQGRKCIVGTDMGGQNVTEREKILLEYPLIKIWCELTSKWCNIIQSNIQEENMLGFEKIR